MADVVKWLTHWIVVPTCVGSIPTIRPMKKLSLEFQGFFIVKIVLGTIFNNSIN